MTNRYDARTREPPHRPLRALYPRALEREYLRWLLPLLRAAHRVFAERLLPEVHRFGDDYDTEMARIFGDIRVEYERVVTETRLTDAAWIATKHVSCLNRLSLSREFRPLLGADVLSYEPWLQPLAQGFVRDNVALIRTLHTKHFDGLERRALETFRTGHGQRSGALSKEIREQYQASQKRAKLIARDQIGNLNSAMTRQRQKALGVTHYIWRTWQDGRVRSRHREREGEVFSWDEPPQDGHPGEPIHCRCTADPVIET